MGDAVSRAPGLALGCSRGHQLVHHLKPHRTCDICSCSGTAYCCSQGCDYNSCRACVHSQVYEGGLTTPEILTSRRSASPASAGGGREEGARAMGDTASRATGPAWLFDTALAWLLDDAAAEDEADIMEGDLSPAAAAASLARAKVLEARLAALELREEAVELRAGADTYRVRAEAADAAAAAAEERSAAAEARCAALEAHRAALKCVELGADGIAVEVSRSFFFAAPTLDAQKAAAGAA